MTGIKVNQLFLQVSELVPKWQQRKVQRGLVSLTQRYQPTWRSLLSPPAVGFSACPGSPLVLTLQPARQQGRGRLHRAPSTVTLSSKAEYQTVILQTLLRAFVVYLISFSHLYWTWASLRTKLTAFGKVTCKGKKSDGVASCCLLNNQGRQVVFALADNRVVSSLYYFPA